MVHLVQVLRLQFISIIFNKSCYSKHSSFINFLSHTFFPTRFPAMALPGMLPDPRAIAEWPGAAPWLRSAHLHRCWDVLRPKSETMRNLKAAKSAAKSGRPGRPCSLLAFQEVQDGFFMIFQAFPLPPSSHFLPRYNDITKISIGV